jgi:Domain of unknown function (DUF4157)/Xanthomonas XOO_2897-like deaminase
VTTRHLDARPQAQVQVQSDLPVRTIGAGRRPAVPQVVDGVVNAPGRPLDAETRALFEPRFRHDFSRVRVHTDARAAESARSVGARAYTVGQHIAFDTGRYAPNSAFGQQLLAHELTHAVQQVETSTQRVDVAGDERLEDQAARAAHAFAGSAREIPAPSRVAGPAAVLQRQREITVSMHPEATQLFSGSIRLLNQGVLFYTVELSNMPPLLPPNVGLACEWGIIEALREVARSGALPRRPPNLRLRLDAGSSKVLRPGHLTRIVRRAARRELKRTLPAAAARESMLELAEAFEEMARHTIVPTLESAKSILPRASEEEPPAEELYEEPEPVEEGEEAAAEEEAEITDVAEECDEDDPDYAQCLKEEKAEVYRRSFRAGGEFATAAAGVGWPIQSWLFGPKQESSGDPGLLAKVPWVGPVGRLSRLRALGRTKSIKQPRWLVARRRPGSKEALDPRIMEAVMAYRKGPDGSDFRRNFGAARVRFEDGTTEIIARANVRGGPHSEEMILGVIHELRRAGHDPAKVRVEQIFTERIPCANCMNEVIERHMGRDIDVFYFLAEAEGRFFRAHKLKNLYY